MKCDELQRYNVVADYDAGTIDVPCDNDKYGKYILADDVIDAIAELKQKLEDAKATAYTESVDAGMRERRLRRALYKACAMWADRTRLICSVFGSNAPKIRWERMFCKCRAKAEQYK